MAPVPKKTFSLLPSDTEVEMVAINKKSSKVYIKKITIADFENIKKEKNFNYYLYQLGYSKFKNAIRL